MMHYPAVNDNADLEFLYTPRCKVIKSHSKWVMFLLRVYNAIKPVTSFCQVFKVEICKANTTVTWQVDIICHKAGSFTFSLFLCPNTAFYGGIRAKCLRSLQNFFYIFQGVLVYFSRCTRSELLCRCHSFRLKSQDFSGLCSRRYIRAFPTICHLCHRWFHGCKLPAPLFAKRHKTAYSYWIFPWLSRRTAPFVRAGRTSHSKNKIFFFRLLYIVVSRFFWKFLFICFSAKLGLSVAVNGKQSRTDCTAKFRLIGYENLCVQPLLQHFFQKHVFGQMK